MKPEDDPRGAAIALGFLICVAVFVLLVLAVIAAPFTTSDSLILIAVVTSLVGGAICVLLNSSP